MHIIESLTSRRINQVLVALFLIATAMEGAKAYLRYRHGDDYSTDICIAIMLLLSAVNCWRQSRQ